MWPLCVQKYTYNDNSRQNNICQGVLTRKRFEWVPESFFRGTIESVSFAQSAGETEIIRSYERNYGTVICETIFPAKEEAWMGNTMTGSAIQFSAEAPIVRSWWEIDEIWKVSSKDSPVRLISRTRNASRGPPISSGLILMEKLIFARRKEIFLQHNADIVFVPEMTPECVRNIARRQKAKAKSMGTSYHEMLVHHETCKDTYLPQLRDFHCRLRRWHSANYRQD